MLPMFLQVAILLFYYNCLGNVGMFLQVAILLFYYNCLGNVGMFLQVAILLNIPTFPKQL
jgi:hypothetical protein